jgi:hypothetical protein
MVGTIMSSLPLTTSVRCLIFCEWDYADREVLTTQSLGRKPVPLFQRADVGDATTNPCSTPGESLTGVQWR